jgi:hypothetical protein
MKPTALDTFKCPNDYASAKEYTEATAKWIYEEMGDGSNQSQEDIVKKRRDMLNEHGCEESKWQWNIYDNTSKEIVVEDHIEPTYNYIESTGCSDDMSNNAYTECAGNALKKIKVEKQNYFNEFQDLIKASPENVLTWDKELVKKFNNWYEKSDKNNHERCVASAYWTVSGSGYEGNIIFCEIFETQRDIQLLKENYRGFKDWNDTMVNI